MKRTFTPISIGAGVVCLAMLVYAFSFPFAVWFAIKFFPRDSIAYVYDFYGPALAISERSPTYLAILRWEAQMLGFGALANPTPVSTPP